EVLEQLLTSPDGIYVDGTVGTGGHSEGLCGAISPHGMLIGLDKDEEAIRISSERLSSSGCRVRLFKENYSRLERVLKHLGIARVNGVLLDLGMSSFQLESSGRGFSFSRNEPLDMRMDLDEDLTAASLINGLSVQELEKILRSYGEERRAKAVSRAIVRERAKTPIDSSLRLANLIVSVLRKSHKPQARHPATRTFQALRIAVNRELETLQAFLENIPSLLLPGGRLVVVSYHSLEDRMVKQAMIDWEGGCRCPHEFPVCRCGRASVMRRVHKKGIKPIPAEKEDNPRARSAILRTAERIWGHDQSDQSI
ncbi:MAG: 16S rRNA (cytosine(1402)-N(4))-methyltransferase RsmH, partial [Deltaproteobacteria bacterium]|nr:16S rRNA (cytosine(1402)-N(4))-methyltransferase RsmH [Deltaproteobacteria bacterium]